MIWIDEFNLTTIMVTHDKEDAQAISDYTVFMSDGRINKMHQQNIEKLNKK